MEDDNRSPMRGAQSKVGRSRVWVGPVGGAASGLLAVLIFVVLPIVQTTASKPSYAFSLIEVVVYVLMATIYGALFGSAMAVGSFGLRRLVASHRLALSVEVLITVVGALAGAALASVPLLTTHLIPNILWALLFACPLVGVFVWVTLATPREGPRTVVRL